MKILMIAPNIPLPPLGSGTMGVYNFAKQWGRRHQVTVVAPTFNPINPDLLASCSNEMGVELQPVLVQYPTKVLHGLNYVSRAVRAAPTIRYYTELVSFLRNLAQIRKFDAVDIEGTGFGGTLYLSAFDQLISKPQVSITFYDVLWHWWKREFIASANPVSLIRWLTYRIWEPRFVRQADSCIFLSDIDAKIVEQVIKPNRTLVVPLGIDTDFFENSPLPDTKELLFVGSFSHAPNVRAVKWLINEIWPVLIRRVPDASLTIVGFNPPAELFDLAQAKGVKLVGNAPDLRPYYAQSQAVIVPILTGGGIRIKILEAFAAARPVVTTSIGAEGLPVIPGEHLLLEDDVEGLVLALTHVLTDPQLAQQLAINGRQLVEREFNWEVLAKKKETAFYPK